MAASRVDRRGAVPSVPPSPSSERLGTRGRSGARRRRRRSPARACATLMLRPVSPRVRPRRARGGGLARGLVGLFLAASAAAAFASASCASSALRASSSAWPRRSASAAAAAGPTLVVGPSLPCGLLYSSRLFFGLELFFSACLLLRWSCALFSRRLLRRSRRWSLARDAFNRAPLPPPRAVARAVRARVAPRACSCCSRSRWARKSASARSSARRASRGARSLAARASSAAPPRSASPRLPRRRGLTLALDALALALAAACLLLLFALRPLAAYEL